MIFSDTRRKVDGHRRLQSDGAPSFLEGGRMFEASDVVGIFCRQEVL